MKIKGLGESEENIIFKILSPYFNEYKFYFYGSRVKGDFRPLSDLDILIKGKCKLSFETLEALKTAFDESDLSFIVNFADYHSISSEFYKTIKDDLVIVNNK